MTHRFLQEIRLFANASIFVLAIVFGGLTVQAQSAPAHATDLKFSVISVRPGDPAIAHGSFEYRPAAGKFSSNSATLDQLIGFAYDVRVHQIVGGSDWRSSARFTIEAIADERAIPLSSGADGTQVFRVMLQALLVERFQFAAHLETRDAPVYELVVGKHGSRLKEGTEAFGGIHMAPGQLTGVAVPMYLFVNQLSRQLGRTVVDKTGLTGKYDLSLRWEPDSGLVTAEASRPDSSGPSIFTAVQEDLGLKLQSTKGPVRFVVIDRLERPSAN
ncbi:MAG: hypothetical protein JWM43_3282 [Acidobacteriaceae bacterium]|nr:hypothetical protein [Acidobacteriaceae bacterium]